MYKISVFSVQFKINSNRAIFMKYTVDGVNHSTIGASKTTCLERFTLEEFQKFNRIKSVFCIKQNML